MLVLFISLYKQRNVILGYTKKMIIIRNNCKIDHRHKYLRIILHHISDKSCLKGVIKPQNEPVRAACL